MAPADRPQISAAPAWAATATPAEAFVRGLGAFATIPGVVLLFGSIGFGALARDMGLALGHALWIGLVFFALPAQVVLADQIGRGAAILPAAFAVSLTAVRLLPMTVTLMPMLRDVKRRRWREVLAVHCIAVTAWIEGHNRLHPLPVHLRLPNFTGFGFSFLGCLLAGTAIGFAMAATVPTAISAALLFMTPIYFMLSMIATSRGRADWLAIFLGFTLGPLFYIAAPGFDLLLAGLIGGSLAHRAGRVK